MAGIYIHIPFCKRKCHYCNFFSMASTRYRQLFLDALTEEIWLQRDYLDHKEIRSVYFGGGTPSLLEIDEIRHIQEEIRKYHVVSRDAEITLEANPDDLAADKPAKYLEAGINRLSIGVQSFHDEDLKYLNRIHSVRQSIDAVKLAKEAGFGNITIDLIYGIPGLSESRWEENLQKAFSLDIQHISAYALTVEPKTALDLLIRKQKLPGPVEEETVSQFRILMDRMKKNGFIHYEISNFCRKGFVSLHNSNYWSGEHYLGLGPSAHSYNGISRQWNVASVVEYIDQIKKKERFRESEILTKEQKFNEYVMTSLRTMWGCDINKVRQEFGEEPASSIQYLASSYISKGMMTEQKGIYTLTDEGKLFADGIASDFFIT
jgi:oxygen-independent coproporphyrinogen III oxidase